MEKLKALAFTCKDTCDVKIGSILTDGIFRYVYSLETTLEKKEDTTSISFITVSLPKYKLTIYLRNLEEVIQTSPIIFYIKIQSRPALFSEVQVMSQIRWQQEDLQKFNPDKDYVASLAFPVNLVIRVEFSKYSDMFDNYLDLTKCTLNSSDIVEISYEDLAFPNYTAILNQAETWQLKYMILVLITNRQMYLTDLNTENMYLINSAVNPIGILEEIYLNYQTFSVEVFREYMEEGVINTRFYEGNTNKIAVRKVHLTPSAIIFEPPEVDVSNRVTRNFTDIHEDYYLRIAIEDENSEKKIWTMCSGLLKKFKNFLQSFEVAGRHYQFLGFSNSQMKNHSCWMIATESGYTADEIRSQLGDFSRCKNNSKYASRLGLCFSGTYRTIKMNRKSIPDIERNGYCFTDGIGRISRRCMDNAKSVLGINSEENVSALQVRIGGCKGVLTLNNNCDEVEVRPSMDKFDSKDSYLEVCNISAYRQGYLNRQIILLLSGLGVEDWVFLGLQENMIRELENALENEEEALKLIGRHDKDPNICVLRYMLTNGIKIIDEPFLQRMLTALYQSRLTDIRNKARISAPDSLILIGVVDEHCILEYGQAFVFPSKEPEPIVGKIVIAKNPCLHPGDIRVLNAVNIPELHYLKDVLVFPQKGDRPHPNECSGSDLDGDMYFISWNQNLIPLVVNEPPMDYTAFPEIDENPSIDGVIDFFIKYMESENLGNIANTHLARADKDGIYHPKVLDLAQLHSKAVDYPKTGVAALIPQEHRVTEWPDYMDKPEAKSYKSSHVIGQMYRSIVDKKIKDFIPLADDRYLKFGYENWLSEARTLYKKYSKELRKLMRHYDTSSEFYFLTYQPGDKLGKHTKVDNRLKMQDLIKDLYDNMTAEFELITNRPEEQEMLASACYWICYSREKRKGKLVHKFLSFPWIFYRHLI
ncbi:hypothetical protein SteCoe_12339 [Stentor coeruleus]|uniref:RNA-dependent RNA polymerase n=1 Tax=Stentor coeruleus TaxID=5963 RepID=A0A060BG32_9CILI|nr:RNA-dependent RNA polymerase-like protein 05 [Stentor coeruleus]OMJ86200.1 hypothetical protein SteCoe_12339 [Stentor coeruleus]